MAPEASLFCLPAGMSVLGWPVLGCRVPTQQGRSNSAQAHHMQLGTRAPCWSSSWLHLPQQRQRQLSRQVGRGGTLSSRHGIMPKQHSI
jgi:hypothetical protein